MALVVTGEKQGDHSTSVDVNYYVAALKALLGSIPALQQCTGRITLQVRAVRVPRRRHEPGIYVVGFNARVPDSLEVLCFSRESTGRPATLVVRDAALIPPILQAQSPSLYESWCQAESGAHGLTRDYLGVKPGKAMRRALQTSSDDAAVKAVICAFRSHLKNNPGEYAMELFQQSQDGLVGDHDLLRFCQWRLTEKASSYCAKAIIGTLVQFGFVELPPGYEFNSQTVQKIGLSDYCKVMAQAWIDEENERRLSQRQQQLALLEKQLGGKKFGLAALLKQKATLEGEIAKLEDRIKELEGAQPELLKAIEF